MSSERDTVQDLIIQLQDLQLQQTELLIRLQRARSNKTRTPSNDTAGVNRTRVPKAQRTGKSNVVPGDTVRPIAIGDKVCIKHPNRFQLNHGGNTKVSTNRYIVCTPSGRNILSAPKNIDRDNE
jgi:hypothetical protein